MPTSTKILIGIVTTVFCLSAATLLIPTSSYLRYQLLQGTGQSETKWIFERIHFDGRPIDVLIVGASNTKLGLSSTVMKEDLARRGLPVEVENFGVLFGGRNLNYAIVKEVFEAGRRPKLLLIGTSERPAHFGHPAFKYLAQASDIIAACYPLNLNYLSDLQYLPFRQIKLAAMGFLPTAFDASLEAHYGNRDFDPAMFPAFLGGKFIDRNRELPRAELLIESKSVQARLEKRIPAMLSNLEFGDEKFYVPKIVELAKVYGTQVAFVYIPGFRGSLKPLEETLYERYGPVFNTNLVRDNHSLFFDAEHLNSKGARVASDWLSEQVAPILAGN